jgi:hypothetical protein
VYEKGKLETFFFKLQKKYKIELFSYYHQCGNVRHEELKINGVFGGLNVGTFDSELDTRESELDSPYSNRHKYRRTSKRCIHFTFGMALTSKTNMSEIILITPRVLCTSALYSSVTLLML